jgi:hypothetical protein
MRREHLPRRRQRHLNDPCAPQVCETRTQRRSFASETISSGSSAQGTNNRSGSNPVKLGVSTCFPVAARMCCKTIFTAKTSQIRLLLVRSAAKGFAPHSPNCGHRSAWQAGLFLPQVVIRAPARIVWRGKLPKIFVDCSTIADSAAIRERLGIDSRLARSQLTSTSSQNPKRRATCCIAARGAS